MKTIIESIDTLIKISKKFKSLSHTLGNFRWHDYTPDISVYIADDSEQWEVDMFDTVDIVFNGNNDYDINIKNYTHKTPQELADTVYKAEMVLSKIMVAVNLYK